jgi:multidrug efflux pump subunit AcrA (membrane-fusion protein)
MGMTAALFVAAAAAWMLLAPEPSKPELLTIQKAPFRVHLTSFGTLEPLRSQRTLSECQWTVRILSLVPEGTWVEKGDIVCVLDSSEIEEFQRSREVSLIKAQAALEASLQQEQLLQARNARRLTEAATALHTAEMDLLEYTNGIHPNEIRQLDDEIGFNQDRLRSAADELNFAERMWMLGYASRPQVDTESLKVTTQSEQLRRLQFQKNLLEDFGHPRRNLEMTHRLTNSQLNLIRTELANSLSVARAKMGTLSDEHRLAIYERYANAARTSIKACTLRAPRSGQVFYCNNWNLTSRGIRTIEEGKSVYFSQPVFEIPDQDHLKITLPLNESLITRVAVGNAVTIRTSGFEDQPIKAAVQRISPYPVVRSRSAPDLKEYLLDAVLEPAPEQSSFLRPRMEAEGTFTILEKPDAISIPTSAIVRCGRKNLVVLAQNDEFLPCEVRPGEVADGRVLIETGLREGDQIVTAVSDEQRRQLVEMFTDTSVAGGFL